MNQADQATLMAIPLFSDLPVSVIEHLAEVGFVQAQPADAVLFQEGEDPRFLHVILSGRVALCCSAGGTEARGVARQTVVEIFNAGDVVIAPAVLLNRPYLLAAQILEPGRIAFLPATYMRELLETNQGFAREAALMLARHWRLLARQLKDQKLRSAPQRLARYLLSITRDQRSGPVQVEISLDRRTLASWLGMSPENLSRSIAQLAELGVHFRGRAVSIDSIARLHAYCAEDDLV